MKLYGYWRSTTSYRVRIGMLLKGLSWETVSVNLLTGEQSGMAYARINPSMSVPALITDEGAVLTQSMAILEWLDEYRPAPPFLPVDPMEKAKVRAAAYAIAMDIHPVNNLRVVAQLKSDGMSGEQTVRWMQLWMHQGLLAFEQLLPDGNGYCFGSEPGLADLCLIPQLYNARRWKLDLSTYPRLERIERLCLARPEFEAARPERQPDAVMPKE